jgi:hypothetical protein
MTVNESGTAQLRANRVAWQAGYDVWYMQERGTDTSMSIPRTPNIEHVRENPRSYLGTNHPPDLRDIAGLLVTDALCLGVHSIAVDIFEDWFVVSADADWILKDSDRSVVEAFSRPQIFHQHHKNSMRATVAVTAFTKEAITVGGEGVTIINGEEATLAQAAATLCDRYPGRRVVAFRGIET